MSRIPKKLYPPRNKGLKFVSNVSWRLYLCHKKILEKMRWSTAFTGEAGLEWIEMIVCTQMKSKSSINYEIILPTIFCWSLFRIFRVSYIDLARSNGLSGQLIEIDLLQ